jgi:hypothetical protein
MRRLGLVAITVLLAVPAVSLARQTPPGDGTLVVRNGRGVILLQIKGAVIGFMAKGKLTLTDNDPYDENTPVVRGRIRQRPKQLSDATTVYKGKDLRFRMLEGSYRLRFEGAGIHLSAVGRGWVMLDGDDRFDTNGMYALNGTPFEPIPFEPTERLKLQLGITKPTTKPRHFP